MESHFNKSYRALYYDELEEYKTMISELSEHLEVNPENIHALNNRAVANWETGKIRDAIEDLKNVLDIGAKDYVPYHNLGEIYEKEGDLEAALELYRTAIELWPTDVSCYRIRAYALYYAERWSEAIPDFDKSIEFDPNCKKTYLDRAKAKEKIGDLVGAKDDKTLASKL